MRMKGPLMSANVTGTYDSRMASHPYSIRKQAASPNITTSHSRVRTNSEPDPSAPAGLAFARPPNGLLKGRPAEQHLSSRHSAPPPDAPEQAERDETSCNPVSTSPQSKPTNGYPHDKPLCMPSRHPRPDSPLPHSTVDVKSAWVSDSLWLAIPTKIALSFLISSQTRARLSVLHLLC